MEKYYAKYQYEKKYWEEKLEKIAANAGKYKLHEIDGIWITAAEMETINSIDNAVLRKLAFVMLCYAKYNNAKNPDNNGWVYQDAKEIYATARISCTVMERFMKFGALHDLGLLEFPKRNGNLSHRVTYVNDDSERVLQISDFRELGYEYLNYMGGNFVRCQECGRLARNNVNKTRKYCSNCQGYVPQNTKTVICIDCGKKFIVSAMNNRTERCDECYKIYRRKYKAESERKRRENMYHGQNN